MNEKPQATQEVISVWSQHRFLLMITGAIGISLFLVGVGLALYSNSGAAQIDLSRPGYAAVRSEVTANDKYDGFPAIGPINEDTLSQFRKLYDKQAAKAAAVDAFANDVLNETTLKIDSPPAQ